MKDIIYKINRQRSRIVYSILMGCYSKFCEMFANRKSLGVEYADYIDDIDAAITRFCGRWFTTGANPDVLPHPLNVAILIKNGRDSSCKYGLTLLGRNNYYDRVYKRMVEFGMLEHAEGL